MTDWVDIYEGDSPLILASPHSGTYVPDTMFARLNARGQTLADTDWHIDRVYDDLIPGASRVRALFHRYVIDPNRDPSGGSLYPGQNTTGLVPEVDFEGKPIWQEDQAPGEDEVQERLRRFHAPYHRALDALIARALDRFGVAILYDCHSIRSRLPFLFEGQLPDLNLGTFSGKSCDSAIQALAEQALVGQTDFTSVVNGRFKGGWTTRHYGQPAKNVHAVQMEIAQRAYLIHETRPFDLSLSKTARLRAHLRPLLEGLEAFGLGQKG
ncbi:N-formylglutamate deformylase [Woodsholea maritima]|uniref:N-formylglutamate deformylase n=1 Tax=Woodsholea maritima TaxID=240237 RepID=UPI000375C5FD|nr:N-formylglutamate deformylase [Woodsholea maritima]